MKKYLIHSIAAACCFAGVASAQDDFGNEQFHMEQVESSPPVLQEEQDPKALATIENVRQKVMADIRAAERNAKAQDDFLEGGIDNLWQFMPVVPPELRFIGPPQPGDDASNGFMLKLYIDATNGINVARWEEPEFTTPDILYAPWNFTKTNAVSGYVTPGLLRVRHEIWDETDLTSWPAGGGISPMTNETHFYIEFTISNATVTAEWLSGDDSGAGANGFPNGNLGESGDPATHIVPILEFTMGASNVITSWVQHQWGNIPLSRL